MDKNERQLIEAELEKIRVRNGGVLTPEAVVRAAKKQSSPLHGCFDWNDTDAAEKWRHQQARVLIHNVQVVTTTSTRTFSVPKYVRDPRAEHGEQGYASLVEIRDEGDAAADALSYECVRAAAVLERARNIAEELGLSDRVDSLIFGVSELKTEVDGKRRPKSRKQLKAVGA